MSEIDNRLKSAQAARLVRRTGAPLHVHWAGEMGLRLDPIEDGWPAPRRCARTLRGEVKGAGSKWNPEQRVWEMRPDK